jgi:hypothetical protein
MWEDTAMKTLFALTLCGVLMALTGPSSAPPPGVASPADSILTACTPDTLACGYPWFIEYIQVLPPFHVSWKNHVLWINHVQAWPQEEREAPQVTVSDFARQKFELLESAEAAASQVQGKQEKLAAKIRVFDASPLVDRIESWKGHTVVVFSNGVKEVIGDIAVPPVTGQEDQEPADPYAGALGIFQAMTNTAKVNQILITGEGIQQNVDPDEALRQIQQTEELGRLVPGPICRDALKAITGRE